MEFYVPTTETTETTTPENDEYQSKTILPYSTFTIIECTLGGFVFAFSVFGIITNIINIIVFRRQGIFASSSTLCLTVLAVADLGCCIMGTTFTPFVVARALLDKSRIDVAHFGVYVGRVEDYFSQISCWMTALASFERMISVVLPFKVKLIFTPHRSLFIILCLCVVFLGVYFTIVFDFLPGWVFDSASNSTVYGIKFLPWDTVSVYVYCVMTLRFLSILIVIGSNIVIFWKVNLSQKFRKATAHAPSGLSKQTMPTSPRVGSQTRNQEGRQVVESIKDTSSIKQQRSSPSKEMVLLRMIMAISAIFTICYLTTMFYYFFFGLVYEFYLYEYYIMVDFIGFAVVMVLQAFNSSINAIVYFTMSSRYREEVYSFFKMSEKA